MFNNYLKIVLRSFLRDRTFSLVNILGLTIGLTTFLAITVYIVDELSYDRFHANGERIYRTVIEASWDDQTLRWSNAPNKLGPTAARQIPEIEKSVRLFHHNFGEVAFLSTEQEKFSERNFFYADAAVLEVFTISLIKGTKQTALARPESIMLSERAAKKYFGDEDPIGKTITVDNNASYEVTAVYENFPSNSLLRGDVIASFASDRFGKPENENWGNASFETFFLLRPDASPTQVTEKCNALLEAEMNQEKWFSVSLQSLYDVRLHSGDLTAHVDRKVYGDLKQVQVLIALAVIVLLIAAINYMNLTTAQSQRRNKEVGISKTLGASFGQLNVKFYLEAGLFVLVSLLLSLAVFTTLLPFFNQVSGKMITLVFLRQPWFWIGLTLVWGILTFLSGFYPAWYLSSFSPKTVLLKSSSSRGQSSVRKALVVFQFATSIVLIICTVMFYKQMDYIRTKKLGYNGEQVVAVMVSAARDGNQVRTVKKQLEALPQVKSVSQSQSYPGTGTSARSVVREGEQQGASIFTTRASAEILEVLDIPLLAGRTLPDSKMPGDTIFQAVINRATVEYLNTTPEEIVGKRVELGFGSKMEVVGVMEDFHTTSLHQKIGLYCFHNAPTESLTYLMVKLDAEDLTGAVKSLEQEYAKVIPSAFEYTFLDDHIAQLYQTEERMSTLVLVFSGLAIFIASLGLYALASFTAEQRIKEIGIRKVLGASETSIAAMFSKEFLVLVGISLIIGAPAGYYFMDLWLQKFAYRTDFNVAVFLGAGLVAMAIAGITVSTQSIRAARRNPVETLRSE